MSKTSNDKWVTLRDKATGNHAFDQDAYGPFPHLFFNLANKYSVPNDMLLTLFFLWDRTVGTGNDCGDCALSQIPVQNRHKLRWLAALTESGFFSVTKTTPGGRKQEGSLYVYENPTAEQWELFFRMAAVVKTAVRNRETYDGVSPARFGKVFARAVGKAVDSTPIPELTPERRAAALRRFMNLAVKG